MKQAVVLITGHICSGKSTLCNHIKTFSNQIVHIDIANLYAQNYPKTFHGKDSIPYHLIKQVVNGFLNGFIVLVELLGYEKWFKPIKKLLSNLPVDLIEIELSKSTIKNAYTGVSIRSQNLNESLSVIAQVQQFEKDEISRSFYLPKNLDATKFITDNGISEAYTYIKEVLNNECR